jgi:hypothetical protein
MSRALSKGDIFSGTSGSLAKYGSNHRTNKALAFVRLASKRLLFTFFPLSLRVAPQSLEVSLGNGHPGTNCNAFPTRTMRTLTRLAEKIAQRASGSRKTYFTPTAHTSTSNNPSPNNR